MKVAILLISIAILAFRNSFYPHRVTLKDAKQTAAYIQTNYANRDNMTADADTAFVSKAIQANRHEVMMAQLALQKSTSAEVKALAQKLVTDHTQLLQQLQNLQGSNTSNNPALSNDSMSNSSDSTGVNNMYNDISGITFDRQWISDMITGHQKAIADFKVELTKTDDGGLKALINNALPVMQEHLRQLQVLRGKMM
jgi:putative membrane protein